LCHTPRARNVTKRSGQQGRVIFVNDRGEVSRNVFLAGEVFSSIKLG